LLCDGASYAPISDSTIKRTFTQSLNDIPQDEDIPISRIKRNEKCVWQRRFNDHIIRDEKDLYNHLDYIHYNPVKHGYTKQVRNWKFSSFHKFIKLKNYEPNWGSESDIKNLIKLEYE
jgi:putative transposase